MTLLIWMLQSGTKPKRSLFWEMGTKKGLCPVFIPAVCLDAMENADAMFAAHSHGHATDMFLTGL